MTTFIEYKEGKLYDTSHLRPFDLALAKEGHPCAHIDGGEVRLIRKMDDIWHYDRWMLTGGWQSRFAADCLPSVRLAPLAIKDGRPLHVGDVITVG